MMDERAGQQGQKPEDQFRKEEVFIKRLLDSLNGLFFTYDTSGYLNFANQKFIDLMGYRPDQIIGKHLLDLVAPEDREKALAGLKARLERGEEGSYDVGVLGSDGQKKRLRFYASPLKDNSHILGGIILAEDITERNLMEQALQESEMKYRNILASIEDGYFEFNLQGDLVFYNDALQKMLGYEHEELPGLNYRQFMSEDDARRVYRLFNAVYRTELPTSGVEWQLQSRDGSQKYVEATVSPIMDEFSAVSGFRGILRDITLRKNVENALEDSKERLRRITDNMMDLICQIDVEGRYEYVSPSHHTILGYDPGDLTGQSIYEWVHPDDRPHIEEILKQLAGEVVVEPFEYRYRHAGDRYIWLEAKGSALLDGEKKLLGFVLASRDIDQRKTSEEAVQETRQRLLDIIEFLPDATLVIDCEGRVIAWNRAIEDMTGVPKEEMLGQGDYKYAIPFYGERRPILVDLAIKPDEDIEKAYPFIERKGETLVVETPIPKVKGRPAVLWAKATPLYDPQGRMVGAIETIRDVTERKQAELALQESQQRLMDIIDFLPDATLVIDTGGTVIAWNRAIEEMTGVPKEEMLGEGDYKYAIPFYGERRPLLADLAIKPDEDIEKTYPFIERKGETLVVETPIPKVKGQSAVLWAKATPLYDALGNIVGAIETIRDVTERQRAEVALKESQQRMADIIDFLPDATFVIDTGGRVIAWNRAIEDMTGVPKEEMLGKDNYEYALPFYGRRRPILADLVLKSDEEIEKTYPFIEKDGDTLVVETPFPSVRGKQSYLWAKATPLFDPEGNLAGVIEAIRDITERKKSEEELKKTNEKLRIIFEEIVKALATTTEKKDPYTAGHQKRVADLSYAIGKEMALPEIQLEEIRIAGTLHDIGKMYVPTEILSKPGQISDIEMLLIRTHPQVAYEIIKSIPFMGQIAQAVLQHHERVDGSGYPYGLSGSEIIVEAKILAVADVVETMSSHRPYRPAIGLEQALDEIKRNSGILYDPEVVDACLRIFKEGKFSLS